MPSLKKSAKQIQIDKANAAIVLIVSVAALLTAFALVSVKTLLSQQAFQSRVIAQQTTALKVAKADVIAAGSLDASYQAFNNASTNLISGTSGGNGAQDGPNSKIVLDALPSQYDFPALITSIQKILGDRGFKVGSITGSDDVTQAEAAATVTPIPVPIPFSLAVTGSYANVQDLVSVFDRSTRPIAIGTMLLTGSDSALQLSISARTYYQPGKTLNVTQKVIK